MLLQHVLLQHHCGSSQDCQHSPSKWRNGARTSAAQKQSFVLLFLFIVIFYNVPIWRSTNPQNPPLLLSIALRSPVKRGSDNRRGWGSLCSAGKKQTKKKKQMLFFLLLDFSSRKPQTKLEKKKNQERRGRLWALSVSLRHPSHPSHLFCLLLIWRVWSSNFQMTSSMSQCFWKYQRRGHSTWTPPPQPLHPFAHAGTVTPLVVAFIRGTWEESPV